MIRSIACALARTGSPIRASLFLLAAAIPAATHAAETTGLWVGEAVLDRVNEVVVSFDENNRRVATPPETLTPSSDQASLRLIVHVDEAGNARLLKGVAILETDAPNGGTQIVLLTDRSRFRDYPVPARRIASVGFEFGDEAPARLMEAIADEIADAVGDEVDVAQPLAGQDFEVAITDAANAASGLIATYRDGSQFIELSIRWALEAGIQTAEALDPGANVAESVRPVAWRAAVAGLGRLALSPQGGALAAAIAQEVTDSLVIQIPATEPEFDQAVVDITAALNAQRGALTSTLGADAFNRFDPNLSAALNALPAGSARAAMEAANRESTAFDATEASIEREARSAVLAASSFGTALRFAHRATLPHLALAGTLAAGQAVSGEVFLGANHPVNPFRHRRHPDHAQGIDLRRTVGLAFDAAPAGGAFEPGGFGADKLTGTYTEELFGLHKPLGPDKDIGLRTAGQFTLYRLDQTGILNP